MNVPGMSQSVLCLFLIVATSLQASLFAREEGPATNSAITVFAASSTTEALTGLAKTFEASQHIKIRLSFAASSVLARQIEKAAPCDIFLSADQKWMDYLAEKKLIQPGSRRDILGNTLVIVRHADKKLTVTMEKGFDLAGAFTGRLAVGDPEHVPAGIYAREALQGMGWWEPLKTRLAPAENVRAALKLVELGETELGIVYASDAKSSKKIAVAGVFPENSHAPIRYPVALSVSSCREAKAFLDYLAGEDAKPVWTAAGFLPIGP